MWYSIVTDLGGGGGVCTGNKFHDAEAWDSCPVRTRNCPDWRALVYATGKELIKEYCQSCACGTASFVNKLNFERSRRCVW